MTTVVFYEKPGCISNQKQKNMLRNLGLDVEARDLLKSAWDKQSLRAFFSDDHIANWFNKNAPQVKRGEIKIEALNEEKALSLLIDNPILIRRPLIELNALKMCGFELNSILIELGLEQRNEITADLERCSVNGSKGICS
ncbi:ArsC/Spx/MgsR family protein [Sessilibacter corallicola]|uniref:ArsC/Spx/MgsR family protein n=1 Tax=Sessilibacter corallicola TaxID=2904075 RepID=UPI001E5DAD01|nr:ArsC/Spx/MgsR family protein [Sessilibacter corallicola]MCE2029674.1 nitrogenase-associated protein [Sessilibacter corallicola]